MGYAQGVMLKDYVVPFVNNIWEYLEGQVEEVIKDVPKWLAKMIADLGLDVALDLTSDITRSFTGKYIYEELQGIADGSGVNYKTIMRVHMIAGLTQGKCSMLGAWGSAIDPKWTGNVLQMRSLDWNMDGPFRDFASVTVYHPINSTYGHSFANVGFPGFIGGLTGVSSDKLGISEIGVSFPDNTFGDESRAGIPFIFLLRDILQFD
jgi:isopenicillin-N N-acyltransferase-like protein